MIGLQFFGADRARLAGLAARIEQEAIAQLATLGYPAGCAHLPKKRRRGDGRGRPPQEGAACPAPSYVAGQTDFLLQILSRGAALLMTRPANRPAPPGSIRLRPATLGDLALLRAWDAQPHVIEAGASGAWGGEHDLARTPAWREQLIAERDGRPIGFVQIIDPGREDSHYWGDVDDNLRAIDIWIGEPQDLGCGHGTKIMQTALERCFADPAVTAVLADPLVSNIRAQRFFQHMGFEFLERRVFGADACCVYRLPRQAPASAP